MENISDVCQHIKDVLEPEEVADLLGLEYQNGKILCPFHNDTHFGSAYLNKGYFHCFACGESGDYIVLVQKLKNCSFIDAVKTLAEAAGIPFDDNRKTTPKERRYNALRLSSEEKQVIKICQGGVPLREVFETDENLYKRIVRFNTFKALNHYQELLLNVAQRTGKNAFMLYEAFDKKITPETYKSFERELTRRIIICEDIIGRFE